MGPRWEWVYEEDLREGVRGAEEWRGAAGFWVLLTEYRIPSRVRNTEQDSEYRIQNTEYGIQNTELDSGFGIRDSG